MEQCQKHIYDVQKNSFDNRWWVVRLTPKNRTIPMGEGYKQRRSAINYMNRLIKGVKEDGQKISR